MKLLGWIKSGTSASNVHSKEQEQLNETIRYLMETKGYCGKCAFQALAITANASSIVIWRLACWRQTTDNHHG